ncbi:MAG TPA: TldD/PmbA family protein [Methylomirabilota bacterium]|nr:TldD/PmbA family protein [Methylomirabilota bacterium]
MARDLAARALDTARVRGATYADARFVHREVEDMLVRNGHLDALTRQDTAGFSLRVIADGAWGFAASQVLTATEADRVAALAVSLARASALVKAADVRLAEVTPVRATYRTPIVIDPFDVPLGERVDLLLRADAAMRAVKGLRTTRASAEIWRETKLFASAEGAAIEQVLYETGCGIEAEAVGAGEMQRRSYPNSGGRHQNTGGWEFVLRQDLVGHAPRIAEEAVALLSARPCPQDIRTTIILSGNQLALQTHESCGHPIELDRVLGTEAAFAGTSFLTPDRLGRFRYGSEHVNIQIDAVLPGGLGTFGFDDEGVPASRGWAVREGRFVGYLTSRETAAALGLAPNGTMRADGWARLPLIRMTNVSVMPGTWTLENLIADTDEGILMDTNRSWSIDDRRLNFQFGTEIAWEIRGGKPGTMLRNATYTGITPEFWGSCDAVCGERDWVMWGTPNCGKGQPGQSAHTGHGAAPARFRNVRVGVLR